MRQTHQTECPECFGETFATMTMETEASGAVLQVVAPGDCGCAEDAAGVPVDDPDHAAALCFVRALEKGDPAALQIAREIIAFHQK